MHEGTKGTKFKDALTQGLTLHLCNLKFAPKASPLPHPNPSPGLNPDPCQVNHPTTSSTCLGFWLLGLKAAWEEGGPQALTGILTFWGS